jgi:HEPN domain-containing protein
MNQIEDAFAWIEQARSDARTAAHVMIAGRSIFAGDIGCHVALLCAQSLEKCIKGCMFLVGQTPRLTHSVETAIDSIVVQACQRRDGDVRKRLPELFRARGVRGTVRQLLAMTPGNAEPDEPNYEYPWRADAARDSELPYAHTLFERVADQREWVRIALHLADETAKIVQALLRA